jgi:hypothetical protein
MPAPVTHLRVDRARADVELARAPVEEELVEVGGRVARDVGEEELGEELLTGIQLA